MPTTITNTIGATSSPTVPDYTSINAWIAASPSDLTVADEIWDGQCLDQGTLAAGSISGITTDATRYIILECASGASFSQKSGVRTTALTYNTSNGVSVSGGGFSQALYNSSLFTQIIGLQIQGTLYSEAMRIDTSCTVDTCITTATSGATEILRILAPGGAVIKNSLVQTPSGVNRGISLENSGGVNSIYDTTVIGGSIGINNVYSTGSVLIGNAVFGATTAFSGTFGASSGFNATDAASAPGSNNQTSLTFSSQFVNSTNDFRAASSGSGLANNGTPISGITVDISLFTRSASTPTIGCWELAGSPPPSGGFVYVGRFF